MKELYHKLDFLHGAKCGYHPTDGTAVKVSLSWDTTTCPDCRKLKLDSEPESQYIDTRGD